MAGRDYSGPGLGVRREASGAAGGARRGNSETLEERGSGLRCSRRRPGPGRAGRAGGAVEGRDPAAPSWAVGSAPLAREPSPEGSGGEESGTRGSSDPGTALSRSRAGGERLRKLEPPR